MTSHSLLARARQNRLAALKGRSAATSPRHAIANVFADLA